MPVRPELDTPDSASWVFGKRRRVGYDSQRAQSARRERRVEITLAVNDTPKRQSQGRAFVNMGHLARRSEQLKRSDTPPAPAEDEQLIPAGLGEGDQLLDALHGNGRMHHQNAG